MPVSSRAASGRAGAFTIRRTIQADASIAPRVVRCKNPRTSAVPQLHQIQPQTLRLDPLYLFHCGMCWHQQTDTSAGWELIHALKSVDSRARMIAGSFLAKTEDVHVLARDGRRARSEEHTSELQSR